MTGLLGPNGQPIFSASPPNQFLAQRAPGRPKSIKPIMGEAFGNWAGRDVEYFMLPGGGAIQFDTSRLTLADFRKMSEHYQIASSLNVLTFMLHQLDWHIECDDPKVEEHMTYNMTNIWTRLVRSMSNAFKFGFSPNALQFENDPYSGKIIISKVKDLRHEECEVNWKEVEGYAPPGTVKPKIKIFDGIRQTGNVVIPQTNSFWYPLLMENGDYGGRKLLRTAFQPWFFSSLIHLFQNRYFERFGEPVPVGRAPYDDTINVGGQNVSGADLMGQILTMVKNRSAVVLPNDTTPQNNGSDKYDYTIEYLESQMRGADFERYLTRLDEEMSLALFTPLLLLRTADSGGFNQGVAHTQVYLWMLNAIAGDWKEYIDRYILKPLAVYNFGPRAKLPTIHFRKLGTAQQETLRAIVQALISKGTVKPNTEELGQHIGLSLEEVEEISREEDSASGGSASAGPGGDILGDSGRTDKRVGRPERLRNDDQKNVTNPRQTTKQMAERVAQQVRKAFREKTFGSDFACSLGYAKQLRDGFEACGVADADAAARAFAEEAEACIDDMAGLGTDEYPEAESFIGDVGALLDALANKYVKDGE
jgi:hypothetical protein